MSEIFNTIGFLLATTAFAFAVGLGFYWGIRTAMLLWPMRVNVLTKCEEEKP